MVSVTQASRFVKSASRYQSTSSMYIRGLIPRNSTELAEAVPICINMIYQLYPLRTNDILPVNLGWYIVFIEMVLISK